MSRNIPTIKRAGRSGGKDCLQSPLQRQREAARARVSQCIFSSASKPSQLILLEKSSTGGNKSCAQTGLPLLPQEAWEGWCRASHGRRGCIIAAPEAERTHSCSEYGHDCRSDSSCVLLTSPWDKRDQEQQYRQLGWAGLCLSGRTVMLQQQQTQMTRSSWCLLLWEPKPALLMPGVNSAVQRCKLMPTCLIPKDAETANQS